jgi:hypothetical protein
MSGFQDDSKTGVQKIVENVKKARINLPQQMFLETLAWLDAFSVVAHRAMGVAQTLLKSDSSKNLATAITDAERAFAVPVYEYMIKDKPATVSTGRKSIVSRVIGYAVKYLGYVVRPSVKYLGYVLVDATSTAGVAPSLYTNSVIKNIKPYNKDSNILYRFLVFTSVVALKVILFAMSIAALPIIIISAVAAGIAYITGFRSAAKTIMNLIGTELKNISTALMAYTNLNILYPPLVSVPGAVLKLIFVSIVAAPIAAVAAIPTVAAALLYVAGLRNAAKSIMSAIQKTIVTVVPRPLIGLIATVPISNINPVILLKSIFYDPFAAIVAVENSKREVGEKQVLEAKSVVKELATHNLDNLNEIHKKPASEIIATFKTLKDGIRTDIVDTESKKISIGGFEMKRKATAWGLGKVINKDLVFEIRRSGTKNNDLIATIKLESGNNNLKLQFTDNAKLDDQDRIALSFTKMVLGIEHAAPKSNAHKKLDLSNSGVEDTAPIKLDLSNSAVKSNTLLASITGLNRGTGARIDFQESRTVIPDALTKNTSSDALEIKDDESDEDIKIRKATSMGINPKDFHIT